MNYLEFIKILKDEYRCIPGNLEGRPGLPSNSELRRAFSSGTILINKNKVNWEDEVEFPIESLIFFPKGKRKTTVW